MERPHVSLLPLLDEYAVTELDLIRAPRDGDEHEQARLREERLDAMERLNELHRVLIEYLVREIVDSTRGMLGMREERIGRAVTPDELVELTARLAIGETLYALNHHAETIALGDTR